MREVIQKVIATEGEARQLAQAARAEAERLVAQARQQARDLTEQAGRAAKLEAETLLAAAEAEAAREKTERLALATAEIETNIRLDETMARLAVAAAVRCVCADGSNAPKPA